MTNTVGEEIDSTKTHLKSLTNLNNEIFLPYHESKASLGKNDIANYYLGHKPHKLKLADNLSLSPINHKKFNTQMNESSQINHIHSSNNAYFMTTPALNKGRLIQDQKNVLNNNLNKNNTIETQKDDKKVHFIIKDAEQITNPQKIGFSGKKGVAGPGNFKYRVQNIINTSKIPNPKAAILKKPI